jgi:hypothetical protein
VFFRVDTLKYINKIDRMISNIDNRTYCFVISVNHIDFKGSNKIYKMLEKKKKTYITSKRISKKKIGIEN